MGEEPSMVTDIAGGGGEMVPSGRGAAITGNYNTNFRWTNHVFFLRKDILKSRVTV